MAHYYYDLYNMETGNAVEGITIKTAANVIGVPFNTLNKWAMAQCVELKDRIDVVIVATLTMG